MSMARVSVVRLTRVERHVVRRAVAAYRLSKRGQQGPFRGVTADAILEELELSPARWSELASFVIDSAEGHKRKNR